LYSADGDDGEKGNVLHHEKRRGNCPGGECTGFMFSREMSGYQQLYPADALVDLTVTSYLGHFKNSWLIDWLIDAILSIQSVQT